MTFPRFHLLVVCLAGWLTQQQNRVIDFLMEENRTLHELRGEQRLRLNNQQRRRLATKARTRSVRNAELGITDTTGSVSVMAQEPSLICVYFNVSPDDLDVPFEGGNRVAGA